MPPRQTEYNVGEIGDGARVAIGEKISWIEGLTPEQFEQLRQQVDKSIGDRSSRLVPVPSEQVPVDYVDRPELTGPLLAHLLGDEPIEEGRASISVVHGLGGIGKTTVARWLVWRPEIKQRFRDGRIWVTLGKEALDAITVVSDCVNQFDSTFKTKSTVKAARGDLAALLHDRSVLFVVDDVWPGKSADVAKALMVPSLRSRFLLTSRFRHLSDDPEIRAKDFRLDEMSFHQATELIARALRRDLSAAEQLDVKRLCEIVGGHPLALELAAARIKEGRPRRALQDDLRPEIARLEALKETDYGLNGGETRKRRTGVRASQLLSVHSLSGPEQLLFAWLGVLAEDAIITPRMAATLWSVEEETARRHLRTLSGMGLLSAKGNGYGIHDLMHDLAREMLTAPEVAIRSEGISGLGLTLRDAHGQCLGRYRKQVSDNLWHTLPDDGYIHDHLVRHFEQSGWDNELESLLWEESADRQCGWYEARERADKTAGFLTDVGRVWSHADHMAVDTEREEERAKAIGLQLHCALIAASVNSLSAGIPSDILARAVLCRILTLPSALTFARQHPVLRARVDALLALAAAVGELDQPPLLGEALSAARRIDYAGSRAEALAAVAARLPAEDQLGVRGEALSAARGIDDPIARAEALAEVAMRLPAQEALAVARSIDNSIGRASALAEVAERLPAEDQPKLYTEVLGAVRGIDEASWWRAKLLAQVAKRLPAEEALSVARGIDDPGLRARALAAATERMPEEDQLGVLGEALSAARSIDETWLSAQSRAEALATVAERLPAGDQPAIRGEALSIARGIDSPYGRAEALAEVANRLPAMEALAVARGIDEAELQAKALVAVAQRVPAEDQLGVLGEALSAARDISNLGSSPGARAKLLAAVAERLPSEDQCAVFGEALRAACSIGDTWLGHRSRARALTAVAKRLPPYEALAMARGLDGERDYALAEVANRLPAQEALAVARGIDHDWLRAKALAEVAQRLPAEDQTKALGEALSAVRGIDDAWLGAGFRAEALAEVAEWLPPENQPGVRGEALDAARDIDEARFGPGSRAKALAAVADLLPAADQPGVLDEALRASRDTDDPGSRARALVEVAQRLPAEDQPGAFGEALLAARGIDDPMVRAKALAEVAEQLPAEDQTKALGEALSIARGIDSPYGRAEALAEVANRLPAMEALAVAHGIDVDWWRTRALAEVANRLPAQAALAVARGIDDAEPQAKALRAVAERLPGEEAVAVARSIDDAESRARALASAAQRLPAEDQTRLLGEALSTACGIDDSVVRSEVLTEVAGPLSLGPISEPLMHEWVETARILAMRSRPDCVADFAAVLPLVQRLGGADAVRSLGRSIASVGIWWP